MHIKSGDKAKTFTPHVKACWGQKHECSLNWVHAGRERGLSTLVPLFCTSILAVMLQQMVTVSMIGRALVLFFNLIPWAGEGKERKYHYGSLFQLGYLLTLLLMRDPDRMSKTNKNPTPICTYPESGRCCLEALNTQNSLCIFLGALRREKQLSYASGTNQEQSPNRHHARRVSHCSKWAV